MMLDRLFTPKNGKETVTIRVAYDDVFELYELHMNDKPMEVFKKKEDADRAVTLIERAFEEGLINGLLLAHTQPDSVQRLLKQRGVTYGKQFASEEYIAWRKDQGLPVDEPDETDFPFED